MSITGFFRRYPELRVVIVNLKSGTSFRGLVWRHRGPYVVLREVEILSDRDNAAQRVVDGEVAVLRADIDFLQVMS